LKDKDFNFRHPTTDDAQAVLNLMVRCNIAEYGEADSDMVDLLHDWEEIDLSQDAWLATDPTGELVGYAVVQPAGKNLRYDFYTAPTLKNSQLGKTLLDWCEGRAPGFAQQRNLPPSANIIIYLAHVNEGNRGLVEQAGFQPARYHFQMYIDLTDPPEPPEWPPGVEMRTFVPGQDDQAVHTLIQTAFDQPGRTPQPFADWQAFMMRPELFDPSLWFLATAKHEIVGACLGLEYPGIGWVRQLAVWPAWQRKGIGAALLRQAFSAFRERGFEHVGLVVESRRPNAYTFYRSVGMYPRRQYDEYVRRLA
jgi:mycothiol synthase